VVDDGSKKPFNVIFADTNMWFHEGEIVTTPVPFRVHRVRMVTSLEEERAELGDGEDHSDARMSALATKGGRTAK
jgi:hypothetical protein